VRVYGGVDGAYESDLQITGITPGFVGFQAATAAAGGQTYIVENGGKDIWRWQSITDAAPEKMYDDARHRDAHQRRQYSAGWRLYFPPVR
jgi:hypothetical protein